MSWANAVKQAQEVQGGGLYLNLKNDQDTATVVILGEPVKYSRVYNDGKYEVFSPAHEAAGLKPQVRFKIPVWRVGADEAQIFEATAATVADLGQYESKFATHAMVITRVGAAKSTNTVYPVSLGPELSAEEAATAKSIKRPSMAPPVAAAATTSGSSAVPF